MIIETVVALKLLKGHRNQTSRLHTYLIFILEPGLDRRFHVIQQQNGHKE